MVLKWPMAALGLKKIQFICTEHAGSRLDHFLFESLLQYFTQKKQNQIVITKSLVRKCITIGAVYLNAKRVKIASKTLIQGAKVEIYFDFNKVKTQQKSVSMNFTLLDSHILYRDSDFIAVNKPAGLPTQPTLDNSRDNLFESVKKYLSKKNDSKLVYVGLHHRLDRDTSGVVLFTLSKEANPHLSNIFKEKKIQKTYHALCFKADKSQKNPQHAWTIKNFLGEGSKKGKRKVMTSVRSGGKPAETHFEIIKTMSSGFLVQAKPLTGRTHQIRVHLSECGLPIYGEFVYAVKDRQLFQAPRLMLHASSIEFQDYKNRDKIIKIQAPLPEDFCNFQSRL